MEEKNKSQANSKPKGNSKVKGVLKRPLVKLVILIALIIVAIVVVKNITKSDDSDTLVGYQKLITVTDNVYTFIDLDGKVKTYKDYTSMNDFYYNVTSVSKLNDEGTTQYALINKNNKTVVDYGVYDNYIQIVGGKYYKVEKDGVYGIIDYKGNVLINTEYEYISITTVQEATEIIFECQKDNMYYFVTETGKQLLETDVAVHSISYSNKFNSNYNTVIYISIDGVKRYFDIVTGEELFTDIEDVDYSYNILKTDTAISFYDENNELKTQIDISSDYSASTRVYFKKYVVLEQKNVSSGSRAYTYTVYNSEFKEIIQDSNKINPVQDIDGNVYFIINDSDGVRIINEKNKEIVVEGYEYNGTSINNLQYLVLNPIGDTTNYEIYTFAGKKVMENVYEYTQKGAGIVVSRYDDNGTYRELLAGNKNVITISDNDKVTSTDYYLIVEDTDESTISVVTFDGKVKLDNVTGQRVFYVEDYIGIQDGETVNIYSIDTGKVTFTYSVSEYVNKNETVNVIELTTGYYTFSGNTVAEKVSEEV